MASPVHASFQSSNSGGATTTTLTCVAPTGITAGDVLYIIASNDHSATATQLSINTTNYPGWVKLQEFGSTTVDCYAAVFVKDADGTETNVVVDGAANNEMCGMYGRVTGGDYSLIVSGGNTDTTSQWVMPVSTVSSGDWLFITGLSTDGGDVGTCTVSGVGWAKVEQINSGTAGTDNALIIADKSYTGTTPQNLGVTTGSANDGGAFAYFGIPSNPARLISGTSPISTTLTTVGTFDVVHDVIVGGTTSIGGAGGTTTYYFDGHTSIVDASAAWTNDANAFNNDTSTFNYASCSTESSLLSGTGTTAPTSGSAITLVETEFYLSFSALASEAATFTVISGADTVYTHNVPSSVGTGSSGWFTCTEPTGGWTWAKLAELKVTASAAAGA